MTDYARPRRRRLFRDKDRQLSIEIYRDEVDSFSYNYGELLDSGETIDASTWESDGPEIVSDSLSSPTVTVLFRSSVDGYLTNTLTTSDGRTLKREFRVYVIRGGVLDYEPI